MGEIPTFTCTNCGLEKPVTAYWKDSTRPRGHHNRCKSCMTIKDAEIRRRYRKRNLETIKDKRGILRYKARNIIGNLISTGKLIKQPCYLCEEVEVDAHHLNYDYPLKVIWLCRKHHSEVHFEIK